MHDTKAEERNFPRAAFSSWLPIHSRLNDLSTAECYFLTVDSAQHAPSALEKYENAQQIVAAQQTVLCLFSAKSGR